MTWTVSVTADTLEAALALIKGSAPVPAPAPAPAPTSLAAMIGTVVPGGTVTLPAGTFHETSALPKMLTLTGAGMGKTILDVTGLRPTFDKAILVPQVTGCIISDMTLKGASISQALGNNAAGVRDNGPGIGFTLRRVEITGCQDGILTFASDITLDGCNFHDNGAGDGSSHEIYINGSPTTKATITGTTVKAGVLATHALKSRAGTTTISGLFTGTPGGVSGAIAGSVIDIPNGGVVMISNADINLSPGAVNHTFIGHGMENNLNAAAGATITLSSVRLHGNGVAGSIETKVPGATLIIDANCTFDGTVPPALVGFTLGNITGAFRPA